MGDLLGFLTELRTVVVLRFDDSTGRPVAVIEPITPPVQALESVLVVYSEGEAGKARQILEVDNEHFAPNQGIVL